MTNEKEPQVEKEGVFDFPELKKGFESVLADVQAFVNQTQRNHDVRFALWPGQSADGKKHAREGDRTQPTPWEGASDLRVQLVDEAVDTKVARAIMAARRANLIAVPSNGYTGKRSKTVQAFMKWMVHTQIPELKRELELTAQYMYQDGIALTGQFWGESEGLEEKTVTVEDFQNAYPNLMIDQIKDTPEIQKVIVSTLAQVMGVSEKRAKKGLKEILETGETKFRVVGKRKSYPVLRAFSIREDIYLPPYTTDLETCPEIHRVQYMTAEQIRSLGNVAGWNHEWCEEIIERGLGKSIGINDDALRTIDRGPIAAGFNRYDKLAGVVFTYRRLSDEDGVPGIFCTVWSPYCPPCEEHDGYAKHGLLGYLHGEYPFVLWRREWLTRRFFDSRGLPEVLKGYQDQVKSHRDSRIDAASIAVLPPLMYPMGRPPIQWGPGAKVPEKRTGEYHFADRPSIDANTENSENIILQAFRERIGEDMAQNPTKSTLIQQCEVDRFLEYLEKAFKQLWKLYQQFGDDEIMFRVVGLQKSEPEVMKKGDPSEDFDFYLTFDALNFDPEATNSKMKNVLEVAQMADRNGQVDWSELLQIMLESVDVTIAERVIVPKPQATEQIVTEVQNDFAKLAAGIAVNMKENYPPQLAMQVFQQALNEPDVQARMQQDEAFKKRVETYLKQIQFKATQQQNAMIGRMGAVQGM